MVTADSHFPRSAAGQRPWLNDIKTSPLIKIDIIFIMTATFLAFMSWMDFIDRVPPRLGLEYDYSIANIYNFLKWLAIAFVFFALWTHSRKTIHLYLSLVFTGVFFDDAFELHERANAIISSAFNIPAHYAGAFLLAALAFVAATVIWLAWKKADAKSKIHAKKITLLISCLIIFGGGLDTLQSEISNVVPQAYSSPVAHGVGIIEDGLELLIASLVLMASRSFLMEVIRNNGHSSK